MKNIIFVSVLMLFVSALALSQATTTPNYAPLYTIGESFANHWTPYTGTASTDTIRDVSATNTAKQCKFIVGLAINYAVASDSVFLYETTAGGSKYLAQIHLPASGNVPYYLPLNVPIDSSYVVVRRYKTSDVTVIWRP